jgi:hypothetical protein
LIAIDGVEENLFFRGVALGVVVAVLKEGVVGDGVAMVN